MASSTRLSDTAALSRKWQWVLKKFVSKLWVKASFFAALAVASAFLALFVWRFGVSQHFSSYLNVRAKNWGQAMGRVL